MNPRYFRDLNVPEQINADTPSAPRTTKIDKGDCVGDGVGVERGVSVFVGVFMTVFVGIVVGV